MKRFHIIYNRDEKPITVDMFHSAAAKRNIDVISQLADIFDFSKKYDLDENDGLYRLSSNDKNASTIEKYLINDKIKTFYKNNEEGVNKPDTVEAAIIHEKHGIPIMKTVYGNPNDIDALKKSIEVVGGFPIVVKTSGYSHGEGIHIVQNINELIAVIKSDNKSGEEFIIRQFIDYVERARLYVLGDKVIAASSSTRIKGDFSKPVNRMEAVSKKFSDEVEKIAIKATQVLGYEFGGVDVLFDDEGNLFIPEVNFPAFFPKVQRLSGVDIAGLMIDYLNSK